MLLVNASYAAAEIAPPLRMDGIHEIAIQMRCARSDDGVRCLIYPMHAQQTGPAELMSVVIPGG